MDKPIPEAVRDALSWLRAALDCPTFSWDADQRDAAEAALAAAQQPDHIVDATKMVAQQQGQAVACTCPSGDGSLRWPCPAHPAEAQAQGGGEVYWANGAQWPNVAPPSAPVGVGE